MSETTPQIAISIINDSGEYIPARSIVVVTSVEMVTDNDDDGNPQESWMLHHVLKYNCGVKGNVFVTGPSSLNVGAIGVAFADNLLHVALDDNVSPPIAGEEWGPYDGGWNITRGGKGFFAQGYYDTGASLDTAMFLRTFVRAAPSICSSSSSSMSSSSSGSSGSSGSNSSSSSSNCVTVVTNVTCSGGNLVVTYGQAAKCGIGYVYQGQQYRNINTGDYIDVVQ